MSKGSTLDSSLRPKWTRAMVLCLAVLVSLSCKEQPEGVRTLRVSASLDTTRTTIGDVLNFRVRVMGAGEKQVQFPAFSFENPNVSVGSRTHVMEKKGEVQGVNFEVTFWDTGTYTLPSYPVNVLTASGDTLDYTVWTDSLQVSVATVLDGPNPQLRDLKPPVPIPVSIPLRFVSTVAFIVLLFGLLILLWRKRLPFVAQGSRMGVPPESPFEIAKKKLSALRNNGLESPEQIRQFYTDLSYAVREFLEFQYFVRALEMTTQEIETSRLLFPLDETQVGPLLEVLKRADLVKFAAVQLHREVCLADLGLMEEFIEKSRREWVISEPNGVSAEAL